MRMPSDKCTTTSASCKPQEPQYARQGNIDEWRVRPRRTIQWEGDAAVGRLSAGRPKYCPDARTSQAAPLISWWWACGLVARTHTESTVVLVRPGTLQCQCTWTHCLVTVRSQGEKTQAGKQSMLIATTDQRHHSSSWTLTAHWPQSDFLGSTQADREPRGRETSLRAHVQLVLQVTVLCLLTPCTRRGSTAIACMPYRSTDTD